MLNPYAVMYDAKMDIFRWKDKKDGNLTRQEKTCIASGRPCRYSSSGQIVKGTPVPQIMNSHTLFCGLEEDIREGDHLVITLRTGKQIELDLGECHPYSFQWQCEVKRSDEA